MKLEKIDFGKKGMNSLIGGLESDIMDCLWLGKKGKKNCRQVFEAAGKKNKVAYTTISVTLDRMHERGLVERNVEKGKGGLKYLYYPKVSKQELAEGLSRKFVGFLKQTFGEASIAYLKKSI